ncbi:glycoside hydrolase [Streptomyces atratus]|uniref:sialidase family protein n=1 Tax=Streptomyces atratus TaxID=1893 RepID=UPI000AE32B82|nr:sialidase family protein [Streptomyces atratus]
MTAGARAAKGPCAAKTSDVFCLDARRSHPRRIPGGHLHAVDGSLARGLPRLPAPGAAACSTLTRLPDGRLGLLYERADYQHITYASFDLKWLGSTCADITITPPATLKAVTGAEVTVRVVKPDGGTP